MEGIISSKIRKTGKTNTVCYHLTVESINIKTNEYNKNINKLTDGEKKLVITRGESMREGVRYSEKWLRAMEYYV